MNEYLLMRKEDRSEPGANEIEEDGRTLSGSILQNHLHILSDLPESSNVFNASMGKIHVCLFTW